MLIGWAAARILCGFALFLALGMMARVPGRFPIARAAAAAVVMAALQGALSWTAASIHPWAPIATALPAFLAASSVLHPPRLIPLALLSPVAILLESGIRLASSG